MHTLNREESGLKLVHGFARSGRTPCRSGRRALRESADVARISTGLHTAVYPLYISLTLSRADCRALQLYSIQLYSALQRSTVYSLYITPLDQPYILEGPRESGEKAMRDGGGDGSGMVAV